MPLQSIAERHGPGILDIVLKQLNGIVHQGVWRNSMGELVYTKDIDRRFPKDRTMKANLLAETPPFSRISESAC